MLRGPNTSTTEIDLLRGREIVSTLTGAFGQAPKETRLTAMLGYLMAIDPRPFMDFFGFPGEPQRISLETRHEHGRSDILVQTSKGIGIVEAKVDAADPLEQARRYPARWIALLTHRIPHTTRNTKARYVNWNDLGKLLEKLKKSNSDGLRLLSRDLLRYMQEHRMVQNRQTFEIYAREINEPVTLELFLKARIYGCKYEPGSRIAEASYFAPHFGKRIADVHPGIGNGISYVARIEKVGHTTTWQSFQELMVEERGRIWWKQHKELLQRLRHEKWSWGKQDHRAILFLGTPRLAFNPPVRKENLQSGKGWLSKRFLAFDDLFAAWSHR